MPNGLAGLDSDVCELFVFKEHACQNQRQDAAWRSVAELDELILLFADRRGEVAALQLMQNAVLECHFDASQKVFDEFLVFVLLEG